MSSESREGATALTEVEQRLVIESRSLNAVVSELDAGEKMALKTYLQVELNDYLQE